MTIRSNMVATWNTLIAMGNQIQSAWGDEVNENLDDRVSKSLTPDQGVLSNFSIAAGKALTTDTINEKTETSGVTIDGLLLKDGKLKGTVDVPAVTDTLATLGQDETFTAIKRFSSAITLSGYKDKIYSSISHVFDDVGYIDDAGYPTTGTCIIQLAAGFNNTVLNIELDGFLYIGGYSHFRVIVSGYVYSGAWTGSVESAIIIGKVPFTSVRLGYNSSAGKVVIMLGITTTQWYDLKLNVSKIRAWGSGSASWNSASISFVSSEAAYSSIVDTNATFLTNWNSDNPTSLTRYYTIDASLIHHCRDIDGVNRWSFSDIPYEYVVNTTNGIATIIPVNIPDGATITAWSIYSYTNSGGINTCALKRRIKSSSGLNTIASFGSLSNSWSQSRTTSISNGTIDNSTYSYFIEINMGAGNSDTRIRSSTIEYTVVRPQP